MVYLFVGDDTQTKIVKINELKKQYFPKEIIDFNYDFLDTEDLDLKSLEESFKKIPLKVKKRLIVIKNCQDFKSPLKDYLVSYVRNSAKDIILILDFSKFDQRDNFFIDLTKYAKLIRFRENKTQNSFDLDRAINQKNSLEALKILNNLLLEGQKPEQILGSLRYQCQKSSRHEIDLKKKLNFILEADINIKTTRLEPKYALETLIIKLCQ
ncbi:MAG: hypothetical protein AB1472_03770 [Candidatus Omnitrophota bacterium]